MKVRTNPTFRTPSPDAAKDYPESCPEVQVVCVRTRDMAPGRQRSADRGRGSRTGRQQADLRALRTTLGRLRPTAGSALRICTDVGHPSVLSLCAAARRLPLLWCACGKHALGARQAAADDNLRVVPGAMGKAVELDGDGKGFPDELASCLRLGRNGGPLGPRASESGGCDGDRNRRNRVAQRTQVPDIGVSDRCRV